jgi:preprotein translocase subunit SecG
MSNIQTALLIVHTLIALSIIALVLLQRGKGAEAGAAFGAGASGTVFGARGSTNFFSRTTAILATLFFASSLALAFMSSQGPAEGPKSIIESAAPVENTVPPVDDTGSIPDLPELAEPDERDAADNLPALDGETVVTPEVDPEQ